MGMKLFVFGLSQYKRRFYLLMRSLANVQSFNIFSRLDLSIPTAVQICLWLISEAPMECIAAVLDKPAFSNIKTRGRRTIG
eukprot:XP_019076860.1 PREDICTED: uncharacterized protein LOC100257838 isoform X3 [Vitis vinifera]